jgi:predicted RNase H-like HicB family nuclease
MRYEVIIYWSGEDQSFIAEAPELPGCMADGKTHGEALSNLEVVMSE